MQKEPTTKDPHFKRPQILNLISSHVILIRMRQKHIFVKVSII